MRKFLVLFFLFTSLLIVPESFSKEVASSNLDGDSTTQKLVNTFGSDLTKESKDIKSVSYTHLTLPTKRIV